MGVELKPRDTQTKVKHDILSRYLDIWCGIIFSSLRKKRKRDWHFVYVDCFAYTGRYAGESENVIQNYPTQIIYGSPILGIKALDKFANHAHKLGIQIRTNAILIEKNLNYYEALIETLNQLNLDSRVKLTRNFSSLKSSEIAIVNDDSISLVDDLTTYTSRDYTWSFYLLDPLGPSGIPYDFVSKIVSQERHDVMINFMYMDFIRKAGMAIANNLEPQHKKLVDNWTAVFKSESWKKITQDIYSEIRRHQYWRDEVLEGIKLDDMGEDDLLSDQQLDEYKERILVNLYRGVLRRIDPDLDIKLVDVRYPDKERTMFYLFLTTHDPTGALSMNKVLYEAKYSEQKLRNRYSIAKKADPLPGQLRFPTFANIKPIVPDPDPQQRPSTEEIADYLLRHFSRKDLTRREVYRRVTNTYFFPNEVDKALIHLKENHKADFSDELFHDTVINFH